MFTIFDIALWFLSKENMSHIKLQKLCYYAQAWYLALFDVPLINDKFHAWIRGPINQNLWTRTTSFCHTNISPNDIKVKVQEIPANIVNYLEYILFAYGKYDELFLEKQSQSEDPWLNKRIGLGDYEPSTRVVSEKDMKDYYRKISLQILTKRQNKTKENFV
jgi:uncharacterized phage-associated protein